MQNIMLNKTQNKLPTHSDRFNGEFLTRKDPPAKRPTQIGHTREKTHAKWPTRETTHAKRPARE